MASQSRSPIIQQPIQLPYTPPFASTYPSPFPFNRIPRKMSALPPHACRDEARAMLQKLDVLRRLAWPVDPPISRPRPSQKPSQAESDLSPDLLRNADHLRTAQSLHEVARVARNLADAADGAVTAILPYARGAGPSHKPSRRSPDPDLRAAHELQEVAQVARRLADAAEEATSAVQHNTAADDHEGEGSDVEDGVDSRLGPNEEECPICMDAVETSQCFAPGDCDHILCDPCARTYLRTVAVETKRFPIPCPTCSKPVNHQKCLGLLAGDEEAFDALHELVLEKVHMKDIRYCANTACASPFDWEPDPIRRGTREEFRVFCPLCEKETCVQCKVEWHLGKSCQQYVSEQEADNELLKLAREQKWKSCPRCGNMIERRIGDCNFVRCRCGCGFCHKCGVAYRDLQGRSNNSHGTPGCTCGLFGADYYMERLPNRARMGAAVAVGADYIRWRIDMERQRAEGRRVEVRRVRRQRLDEERVANRVDGNGNRPMEPAGAEYVARARGRVMRIRHDGHGQEDQEILRDEMRPFAQAAAARVNVPVADGEGANVSEAGVVSNGASEHGGVHAGSPDGARVMVEEEEDARGVEEDEDRGLRGWMRRRKLTGVRERSELGTGKKVRKVFRRAMSTLEGFNDK